MSFVPALEVQQRVLAAILRRQIHESLGRGGGQLFLGVVEPMFALSIAIIWHTLLRTQPAYGTSKVLFVASGLYSTYMFVHMSAEFRYVSKASTAQRRFPAERTLDLVLASVLMKLTVYIFAGLVGFGVIYAFITPEAEPSDWVPILLSTLALALLGLGMGLCNAAIEQLLPIWRFIWNPIARGLILFSGVIYVPDFLPVHIRDALRWNPVLQGVEYFRHGFYPGYPTTCFMPVYLWLFGAVLLLAGLCADRVFRRKLDEF
jgi:capsular polysaccharide transport system permease protein